MVLLVVASVIGLGTAVYWLSGTEAERGLGAYAVLLGLPYLLFAALRRPEMLIGEDSAAQPESTQTPIAVSSMTGRSWAIFVLVLPLLLFGCGCCTLTFIGMLGAQ